MELIITLMNVLHIQVIEDFHFLTKLYVLNQWDVKSSQI